MCRKSSSLLQTLLTQRQIKMKKIYVLLLLVLTMGEAFSQEKAQLIRGRLSRIIPPLKDIPPIDESKLVKAFDDSGRRIWANPTHNKKRLVKEEALPEGYTDPLLQKMDAAITAQTPNFGAGISTGIEGQSTGSQVYDPTICVGPNHIIQLVNTPGGTSLQIWSKNGTTLVSPVSLQALSGNPGSGDPIALYDQLADRFIVTEFIIGNGSTISSGLSILVSRTNDPTQGWFAYRWLNPELTRFPDYPKWAVGPTGLFVHTNNFGVTDQDYKNSSFIAFNKNELYSGSPFFRSVRITQNIGDAFSTCAVQLQGSQAPSSGQLFVGFNSSRLASTRAAVIECNVNWTNNTLTQTNAGNLTMASFSSNVCDGSQDACVRQPGTTQRIETLTRRIMNQPILRVLPDGQSGIVFCFTVNAGSNTAGIRWAEARKGSSSWSTFQAATWHPNSNHQFMGSIAYDAAGNIGLAYCTGSSNTFLGIRYTGRKTCDPLNQMTIPETSLRDGNAASTFGQRWGDYSHLVADPNGESLWFTSMYGRAGVNAGRGSYISQFAVPACGDACLPPTALSSFPSSISAAVIWQGVAAAATYTVEFKTAASSNWVTAGTTLNTFFTISGINPLTLYDWRVRTDCAGGSSAFTVAQFTTAPFCQPNASIFSNNINSTTAQVNWTPVVFGLTYSVEFKPASSPTWIPAITTSGTSFTLTGLTPSTLYDWRVKTNCAVSESIFTASQFTTTTAPACGTPTSLSEFGVCFTAFLEWSSVPGATAYQIDYRQFGTTEWLAAEPTTTSTSTTFDAGTGTYEWRVRANCGGSFSDFANSTVSLEAGPECLQKPIVSNRLALPLKQTAKLKIMPQPADDEMTIRYESAATGTVNLKLNNSLGALTLNKNVFVTKGSNTIRLDVRTLPPGVYVLLLTAKGSGETAKVVIE